MPNFCTNRKAEEEGLAKWQTVLKSGPKGSGEWWDADMEVKRLRRKEDREGGGAGQGKGGTERQSTSLA